MKQFKTSLGVLRGGTVLPSWKDDWQDIADETPVILYKDGSVNLGSGNLLPLPLESYGSSPPEGWEELPWIDIEE